MPCDLPAPAGLERLQECFFRREAPGIRLRCRDALRVTVLTFPFGKNALAKPWCPLDRFCDTIYLNNVNANRDDHFRCDFSRVRLSLARTQRRTDAHLRCARAGGIYKRFLNASRS